MPRVIDRKAARKAIKDGAPVVYTATKKTPAKNTPTPPIVQFAGPGQPTKYQPGLGEQVRRMYLLGLSDDEVAAYLGIALSRLFEWDARYPEFKESRARGKLLADADMAHSLYERGRGFTRKAVKIIPGPAGSAPIYAEYDEYYPPDANSAFFWLKNRQGDRWKEKWETTNTNVNVDIVMDPEARRKRIAELSKKLGPVIEGTVVEKPDEEPK